MPRKGILLALLTVFAAIILVLPLTFGLPEGGSPPDSITDSGDAINEVYWVVFGLAAFVFLVVEATLILFIFRFRRRGDTPPDVEGPQIHGNTRVEVLWTIVPAVMLLGLAIYTFSRVPAVEAKPGAGESVFAVDVTAHQFYWEYRYPNGALSFDTLYLPAGRKVTLALRSRDVPHSWWVPQLTGKRDALPGQTNRLHFEPRRTGVFTNGVCGEFCGIQHARMTTRVEVLEEGELERWLDENAPADDEAALVELGREEWRAACAKCHGFQGEGDIGPTIAGNGTLTNAEPLTTLLYEGQDTEIEGYMPPVGKGWDERQIQALVAYVRSERALAGGEQDGG